MLKSKIYTTTAFVLAPMILVATNSFGMCESSLAPMILAATSSFGMCEVSQTLPKIESIKWGELKISHDGKTYVYNEHRKSDAKLWPGCVKVWNWKETNTHHNPGIQIADLKEFIDKVDVVILTRGMKKVLQVPQATIDWVKSQGKECYDGQTEDMVKKYNKLVDQGKKVGGVFHSTC